MKEYIIATDKKSNFFAIALTPAACAVVPAIGGFILANSKDPIVSILVLLAVAISFLIFHVMALDWRDTKLSNTALSVALKQRDKEIREMRDPDRIEQTVRRLAKGANE